MTKQEAMRWIDLHYEKFEDGPTIIGSSDKRIIAAGELCKQAIETNDPVSDDEIDAVLGDDPLPPGAVI